MSRRTRLVMFAPALAGVVALLVWGLSGLHDFGHYPGPYGKVLAKVAVPERKATDVVSSTTFDYRGFDTLGEEMILFVAALGLVVLLLSIGYVKHGGAPIFKGVKLGSVAVDPVVQALTLTDIVVSVTVVGLILALALNAYDEKGTVDPDELPEVKG